MNRSLVWTGIVIGAAAAATLGTACDTKVETVPTTTTTTTTTTTGGTGGTGAVGGGGTGGEGALGGGGAGGEGGAVPSGADTCPGDPFTLSGPGSLFLSGDTSTATDDYQSFCATGNGPDTVYELTIETAGTLRILVSSTSSLDPVLYFRAGSCDQDAGTFWCRDLNPPSSPTTEGFATPIDPGTYYVVVDGANDSAGTYTLNISLTAPVCGDSVVNPGEDCDDGNLVAGDGCLACQFETGSFETCATPEATPVTAGTPIFLHGWTTANADDLCPGDDCLNPAIPGVGGHDRVVLLQPQQSGTLTATIGMDKFNIDNVCDTTPFPNPFDDPGCWDHILYVYQGPDPAICNSPPGFDFLDYADGNLPTDPETLAIPVTAGVTYFLVIDGYYNDPSAWGEYYLHLSL